MAAMGVAVTDMHVIASTAKVLTHHRQINHFVTASLIASCCWLIVFVYSWLFRSPVTATGCCGCYCLLLPADWPFDCWFPISPVTAFLHHRCWHLLCSKCGWWMTFIEHRQCNVRRQHRRRSLAPSSNFFSWHMWFFIFTMHVPSVLWAALNCF